MKYTWFLDCSNFEIILLNTGEVDQDSTVATKILENEINHHNTDKDYHEFKKVITYFYM